MKITLAALAVAAALAVTGCSAETTPDAKPKPSSPWREVTVSMIDWRVDAMFDEVTTEDDYIQSWFPAGAATQSGARANMCWKVADRIVRDAIDGKRFDLYSVDGTFAYLRAPDGSLVNADLIRLGVWTHEYVTDDGEPLDHAPGPRRLARQVEQARPIDGMYDAVCDKKYAEHQAWLRRLEREHVQGSADECGWVCRYFVRKVLP